MARFISPLVFLGGAGWMYWYDQSHPNSVAILPFIQVIVPSTRGSAHLQATYSIGFFAVIGAVLLLNAIRHTVSDAAGGKTLED